MATVARGAVRDAIWEMEHDEMRTAIRWQLQELASRDLSEEEQGPGVDLG
jgi:hypothetical protein